MSATISHSLEGNLPSDFRGADDTHSELGDGSSSLSDIENDEADQDEEDDQDDADDLLSENDEDSDANDSEAETERLENSPHSARKLKDVVLSSQAESRTYERSPSKLQHEFNDDDEDEDDEDDENELDNLSDDEASVAESVKSIELDEAEPDPTTATTSLEDPSETKPSISTFDLASKKRKRSLLPEGGLLATVDLDEPARKRTGSIGTTVDDYAIDDTASANGDLETSNNISGDVSDLDSNEGQDDEEDENADEVPDETGADDDVGDPIIAVENEAPLDRKNSRKRRGGSNTAKISANGIIEGVQETTDGDDVDEGVDIDADEAELTLKNEEEQEKKNVAHDQLGDIERLFKSFKDRLYDDRLAQLEKEEIMLRQENPTHPEYLAMLECLDARRDEKIRIQDTMRDLRLETLMRNSIGKRSSILSHYYQEIRGIREDFLENLGKQWYDIQHDRRTHGASVEDYVLKFPTRKSQQISNQIAINTEISIKSGIAKYVGFPAAPPMTTITSQQIADDLGKISALLSKSQRRTADVAPLQNMAAMRAAASSTFNKPAEEQFIEQTPWANPQHPSNAHLIQRQASAHQAARTGSPFTMTSGSQPPRLAHQHITTGPIVGTFSPHSVGNTYSATTHIQSGGGISSSNPFTNVVQKALPMPSPLGNSQKSSEHSKAAPIARQSQDIARDGSNMEPAVPNLAQRASSVPGPGKDLSMEPLNARERISATGEY